MGSGDRCWGEEGRIEAKGGGDGGAKDGGAGELAECSRGFADDSCADEHDEVEERRGEGKVVGRGLKVGVAPR